ncbi:hypothetical protein L914_10773 [Phytophthora nicotianae]|uniref:Uncharacterized protein n=1 Tax=Phytophthora nicotianae TaxID=4792 RepID=W2N7R4_PHYNI|nr:hypothetical protein L914_10773 [Phytophthora nicotianae]
MIRDLVLNFLTLCTRRKKRYWVGETWGMGWGSPEAFRPAAVEVQIPSDYSSLDLAAWIWIRPWGCPILGYVADAASG